MRKVFGLPGVSGWALTMGMTTGFPAGAQATIQLTQQGDLTPPEAERLGWLSHFCNPMTLIIVIGIGLFEHSSAGYWLIIIHWMSGILAFLTFVSMRHTFRNKGSNLSINSKQVKHSSSPLHLRVWRAIHQAHTRDGRSFGKLLGESVSHAVQTLMVVGGYIIIMAVIIHLINSYIVPRIPNYYVAGFVELHLGAKAISTASTLSSVMQWSLLSAILGWSGICAILQTISPLITTGMRWLPFIVIRLLHGTYAFVITIILWTPMRILPLETKPAFFYWPNVATDISQIADMWSRVPLMLVFQGCILISLLLISWSIALVTRSR
ncbi:Sporulation integral membrane protein YlbJ [compost metagenome]